MDADTAELEDEIDNKNQEIEKLKDQLSELKEEKTKIEKVASHSEEFELKEKAMDNILKLVSMQDMTKLSRD
jgi:predicted  nucleic acid-binding Zn-ribbon protein